MTKLVWALIDKLTFFAAALLGMQVPMWLVQYKQRLGGQLDEASLHLSRYQSIADTHTSGDLTQLINQFRVSADPATRDTGHVIWQLHDRVEDLGRQMVALDQSNIFQQLLHLGRYFNPDLAQATLHDFQPGLVLSLDALLLAIMFGLFVSTVLYSVRMSGSWVYDKLNYRRMPSRLRRQ